MRDVVAIVRRGRTPIEALVTRARDALATDATIELSIEHAILPGGPVALIQAERADAPVRARIHRAGAEAFAFAGYVDAPDAGAVRRLVALRRGWFGRARLELDRSPGGVAAFFLADGGEGTIYAWSSLAGVQGVFHTEGDDAIVLATRPWLSHVVATGARPVASQTWARHVLAGGTTLWHDTPLEGTFQVPPRGLLIASQRGVRVGRHPLALREARFPERSREAVAALVAGARSAISVVHRYPRPELQLSGGKDSRFVAALVKDAGIEVDPVTYAAEGGGEGIVAAQIATALGLPHRLAARDVATGAALRGRLIEQLRRTDGRFGEARQLAYGPIPHPPGQARLEGQAHHPRNGFLTLRAWSRSEIAKRMRRKLIGDVAFVEPTLARERRGRARRLVADCEVADHLDLAFWLYNDLRMPTFLQAGHALEAGTRPVLYPFLDERLLATCARVHPADRISEVAFFAALIELAPALAGVPLYDDTWRFDDPASGTTAFEAGFATRAHPVGDAPMSAARRRRVKRTPEKRTATVLPLARSVLSDLSVSPDVRAWLAPGLAEVLLREDDPAAVVEADNQLLLGFLWRLTAVGLVLEGGCFAPIRVGAGDAAPVVGPSAAGGVSG